MGIALRRPGSAQGIHWLLTILERLVEDVTDNWLIQWAFQCITLALFQASLVNMKDSRNADSLPSK
jgi:hypothetical protein